MTRFIADGMLGRFTRWLRFLGYEVKYSSTASDDSLLEMAEEEDWVLLTRDLELFRRAHRRGLEAMFLEGESNVERIAEVAERYRIRLEADESVSRCPACGSRIKRVERAEISDRVPEGTLRHYKAFWLCVGCSKVYWRGSHWKRIRETLEKVKELL